MEARNIGQAAAGLEDYETHLRGVPSRFIGLADHLAIWRLNSEPCLELMLAQQFPQGSTRRVVGKKGFGWTIPVQSLVQIHLLLITTFIQVHTINEYGRMRTNLP